MRLFCVSVLKFDGADGSGPLPNDLLYFDGVHQVNLTHCEFRSITSGGNGLTLKNGQRSGHGAWNYIHDC